MLREPHALPLNTLSLHHKPTMNIIPTQELKDFILSQPDDRPINMKETQPDCSCGCILIQFQKEKGLPPATVGYTFVGDDNAFPTEVEAFIYRDILSLL